MKISIDLYCGYAIIVYRRLKEQTTNRNKNGEIDMANRDLIKRVSYSEVIESRVVEVAEYIIKHRTTVRETAKIFGVSKTTVQNDINTRLENISPKLKEEVQEVTDYHLSVRHLRGGATTGKKNKENRIKKRKSVDKNFSMC